MEPSNLYWKIIFRHHLEELLVSPKRVDRGKWTSSYLMKTCATCSRSYREAGIGMRFDCKRLHLKPKLKRLWCAMMSNTIITFRVVLLWGPRVIITPLGTCLTLEGSTCGHFILWSFV